MKHMFTVNLVTPEGTGGKAAGKFQGPTIKRNSDMITRIIRILHLKQ